MNYALNRIIIAAQRVGSMLPRERVARIAKDFLILTLFSVANPSGLSVFFDKVMSVDELKLSVCVAPAASVANYFLERYQGQNPLIIACRKLCLKAHTKFLNIWNSVFEWTVALLVCILVHIVFLQKNEWYVLVWISYFLALLSAYRYILSEDNCCSRVIGHHVAQGLILSASLALIIAGIGSNNSQLLPF